MWPSKRTGLIIAGILLARLIYKGTLLESVGLDNWWNSFFKEFQEDFKEKEKELDEKSKELLRLVEKANKPFEPLTKLPDWPPPFVAKETQEVPEVPSKKTGTKIDPQTFDLETGYCFKQYIILKFWIKLIERMLVNIQIWWSGQNPFLTNEFSIRNL